MVGIPRKLTRRYSGRRDSYAALPVTEEKAVEEGLPVYSDDQILTREEFIDWYYRNSNHGHPVDIFLVEFFELLADKSVAGVRRALVLMSAMIDRNSVDISARNCC